ncbi:MAG: monovalent cation/H(+) antiporter subunit G [Desulfohalobiaceae bacterium]
MSLIQEIVSIMLMAGGVFFMLVGSLGLIRLPDFFTRVHAAGKVDTLGVLMFVMGMIIYSGFSQDSAKLFLIFIFVAMTSPVASHALARRAMLFGYKPWKGPKDQRRGS